VIGALCRADAGRWWVYSGIMRYPDGGGLSDKGRARREVVRLQAAGWFAQGVPAREVAKRLRVSTNSAYLAMYVGAARQRSNV
jgi:hypothetical protein